jgi:hypothetical protein
VFFLIPSSVENAPKALGDLLVMSMEILRPRRKVFDERKLVLKLRRRKR